MPQILSYTEATYQLKEWTKALAAASSGASYSIGGRTLTRQDIEDIRGEIQRWHNTVLAMEAQEQGNIRPLGATAAFPTPGSRGTYGHGWPGDSFARGFRQ